MQSPVGATTIRSSPQAGTWQPPAAAWSSGDRRAKRPDMGSGRRKRSGSEPYKTAHAGSTSETLPVFSKPYSDLFCSSSSCCLLCRHTKHLKDKAVSTLPVVYGRDADAGTDTRTACFLCDSKLSSKDLAHTLSLARRFEFEFSKSDLVTVPCGQGSCPNTSKRPKQQRASSAPRAGSAWPLVSGAPAGVPDTRGSHPTDPMGSVPVANR